MRLHAMLCSCSCLYQPAALSKGRSGDTCKVEDRRCSPALQGCGLWSGVAAGMVPLRIVSMSFCPMLHCV